MSLADTAHVAVVYSIDGAAIAANLLFIAIIFLRTPVAMRSYAVFLLNNAMIDVASAVSSALIVTRVVILPNDRLAFAYLGQCAAIAGSMLCRVCESSLYYLVNQSTAILLLSFGYRLFIIRSDMVVLKMPPMKLIWLICMLSHVAMSPILYVYYTSLHEFPDNDSDYLREFGANAISLLHIYDVKVITFLSFAAVFSSIATSVMYLMRKSLLLKISSMSAQTRAHHLNIAKDLSYQMLLPIGVGVAVVVWLLDFLNIYNGQIPQRFIIVGSGFPAVASPFINMIFISPYRKFFSCSATSLRSISKT